jgi:outer membrane immunogenic protein
MGPSMLITPSASERTIIPLEKSHLCTNPNGLGGRATKLIVASIALLIRAAGADIAIAADLSAPYLSTDAVPYGWTGLYFGVDGGYGRTAASSSIFVPGSSAAILEHSGGITGSVLAGFNWEIPTFGGVPVVVGWETEIQGGYQTGTETATLGSEVFSQSLAMRMMGEVRGRLGLPIGFRGSWLPYITVGVGMGNFRSITTVSGPVAGVLDGSSTQAVWTAGAGIEYGIVRDWSWRIEYEHIDTGNITVQPPSLALGVSIQTSRFKEDNLLTGIAYHY